MSNFARKVKRSGLKAQYQKFATQWGKKRSEQIMKSKMLADAGIEEKETEPKLGTCPTFKQWKLSLEKIKEQALRQAPSAPEPTAEELSWGEDA